MAPKGLSIQLDDAKPKYFPGDFVVGRIYVTPSSSYELNRLELQWVGRVRVQSSEDNKDARIIFRKSYQLKLLENKPKKKKLFESTEQTFLNEFVETTATPPKYKLKLAKNKTVCFTFKIYVPNDRSIPSSTEDITSANNIFYVLEAITNEEAKDKLSSRKVIPIYEYIETPSSTESYRNEKRFTVRLYQPMRTFKSRLAVAIPCRGCCPGTNIPLSISIESDIPYSRSKGVSIALMRVDEIFVRGIYKAVPTIVEKVIEDVAIAYNDQTSFIDQKIRTKLLIPKKIVPTITIDKGQLLSVSYLIRVQAYAQEGEYISADNKTNAFMRVELPFVISTVSSSAARNGEATSPYMEGSIQSLHSVSNISPLPSRSTTTVNSGNTVLTTPLITIKSAMDNQTLNSPITSPQLSAADSCTLVGGGFMSGLFRRSSAGSGSATSNQSVEERKKTQHISLNLFKGYTKYNSDPKPTKNAEKDDSGDSNNSKSAAGPTLHNSDHLNSTQPPSVDILSQGDNQETIEFSHQPTVIGTPAPTSPHNDQPGERGGIPVTETSQNEPGETRKWKLFGDDSDDDSENDEPVVSKVPSQEVTVDTLPIMDSDSMESDPTNDISEEIHSVLNQMGNISIADTVIADIEEQIQNLNAGIASDPHQYEDDDDYDSTDSEDDRIRTFR